MMNLDIYIEIHGEQVKVGKITGKDSESAVFSYSNDYLAGAGAVPLSVSLPLQSRHFTPEQTRSFFSGLLPEGFMRRRVSELVHTSEDDYVEILKDLGSECIGAVRVQDSDHKVRDAEYVKLTTEEIAALAGEGVIEASELVMKAHLSLTGASGKVGLYHDAESGNWYLPVGDAPSTHIVKQSHVRLSGIVTNEQLCLKTASRLGIEVPDSFIVDLGSWHDSDILLATERFDRTKMDKAHKISGLKKPYRLHQEDFCQAMGMPASQKYEGPEGRYLHDAFKLILDHSARPLEDQLRLWDIIVFDYLAGNTDNHLKNVSFLYSSDLRFLRLAPAYDLLSTTIYDMSTENMAFSIGGDLAISDITRDSFVRAAEEAGIGKTIAMKRFDRLAGAFEKALTDSSAELSEKGFANAGELKDRILETGGISRL